MHFTKVYRTDSLTSRRTILQSCGSRIQQGDWIFLGYGERKSWSWLRIAVIIRRGLVPAGHSTSRNRIITFLDRRLHCSESVSLPDGQPHRQSTRLLLRPCSLGIRGLVYRRRSPSSRLRLLHSDSVFQSESCTSRCTRPLPVRRQHSCLYW